MTIYLEYVFLNNFAINVLIVYAALDICGKRLRWWRVCLSGAIGAAFSILYIYISQYAIVLKVGVSLIMLLVAASYRRLGEFLRVGAVFYIATFALAGGVLMLNYFNATDAASFAEFGTLKPFCATGGVLCGWLLIKYASVYLKKRRKSAKYMYECRAYGRDASIMTQAYFDTGNKLCDEDGLPVQVISKSIASRLALQTAGKLVVATVSGILEMQMVDLSIDLYLDNKVHKLLHTKAVISDVFDKKDYDIILNRETEVFDEATAKKNRKMV